MDKDTREALLSLTAEVSRLSALVESHARAVDTYAARDDERDADKETRLRRIERWLYALPVAYVLTLGSVFTSIVRLNGKGG